MTTNPIPTIDIDAVVAEYVRIVRFNAATDAVQSAIAGSKPDNSDGTSGEVAGELIDTACDLYGIRYDTHEPWADDLWDVMFDALPLVAAALTEGECKRPVTPEEFTAIPIKIVR
jgi:hypothetical protein